MTTPTTIAGVAYRIADGRTDAIDVGVPTPMADALTRDYGRPPPEAGDMT